MKIEPYTHCNQAKDFMVDKVDEVRERDRGGREEKRLKRFALVNEDNKTQSIYFGEAFLNCTFLIVAQLRPHAALIQRLYKGGGKRWGIVVADVDPLADRRFTTFGMLC